MDLDKVLAQLRADLENVDQAILSLERLRQATHRRRGRPPLWLSGDHNKKPARPPRARKTRGAAGDGKQPE